METPIYDFLKNYSESNTLRLHMPGHKGKNFFNLSAEYDITEIKNADSLFEADGIIAQSEKNAARLFNTVRTCYSAGGSTLCIQTMLALMKRDNRKVIAVRNVHRSFLSACIMLGIEPEWIYPEYSAGFLSGEIPLDILESKLKQTDNPCVYITSPDYLGKTADIKSIAAICHKYNGILLVDNAHGAHFAGSREHPVMQGADMCCDSGHKMLPVLTGGAYLHIANQKYADSAKSEMSFFASTSPSYLIMASLDLCNDYIENSLPTDRLRTLDALDKLRNDLSKKYKIYKGEPFHLTLLCDGISLAEKLRKDGIECEYADRYCVTLLFSPLNSPEEIERAGEILMRYHPLEAFDERFEFPVMKKAMSIREAALCRYETVSVENSAGKICAAVNVPCPPAVPIAVSGEIINEICIKIFKKYGILKINVVK